jgi:hypothetical protein
MRQVTYSKEARDIALAIGERNRKNFLSYLKESIRTRNVYVTQNGFDLLPIQTQDNL